MLPVSRTVDGAGRLHADKVSSAAVAASRPSFEADAVVFIIFWLLFITVFLQFFTRYVLNDSYAWTEEIARYLLIGVGFVGSVMAMRKGSHITVEAGLAFMGTRLPTSWLITLDAITSVTFLALVALFYSWYGKRRKEPDEIMKMTREW